MKLANPGNVIIILYLHNLIAFAEGFCLKLSLPFAFCGRVYGLLKKPGEIHRSGITLLRRTENLNISYGVVSVGPWQSVTVKTHNIRNGCIRILPFHMKEVVVNSRKLGHFTPYYPVCVCNNEALHRLTKNLIKTYNRQEFGFNQVMKHVSCTDGRKLVGVTHHYKPTAERQRREERGKKHDIHHGKLINNDHIRVNRTALISSEMHLTAAPSVRFKQAMNRLCLFTRYFGHALCRPARRCAKHNGKTVMFKERQYTVYRSGLSGARPGIRTPACCTS